MEPSLHDIAAHHLMCSRPPDLACTCHEYLRQAVKELLTALFDLRRPCHLRPTRGGLPPQVNQGAAVTSLHTRAGNEYLQQIDQPMPGSDDDCDYVDDSYDFDICDDRQSDSSPPAARCALRSFNTSNMPSFKDIEQFHIKHREDWPMLHWNSSQRSASLIYSFVVVNVSDISQQPYSETDIDKAR